MPNTNLPSASCASCAFAHGTQHGCPPPDLVAAAREYIAATEWTFAKTMPDNPHWYAVRQRAWAVSEQRGRGHESLFELIRWFYVLNWFQGRGYRSVTLDGHLYWIMQDGTVINRKPAA